MRPRTSHPGLSDTESISSSAMLALLLPVPSVTSADAPVSREVLDAILIAVGPAHLPWILLMVASVAESPRMIWRSTVTPRSLVSKILRSSYQRTRPTNRLHIGKKSALMDQKEVEPWKDLLSTGAGQPRYSFRLLLLVSLLAILPFEVSSIALSFSHRPRSTLRV